jgi:glucose uptake protein GlcU
MQLTSLTPEELKTRKTRKRIVGIIALILIGIGTYQNCTSEQKAAQQNPAPKTN